MSPFDYAIGLVSIVVGLGLADLAGNLQTLLRRGGVVKWDGRVILSVALAIVMITGMWFALWSIRGVTSVLSYPFYLWVFLEFMVLYLVCGACLPDEAVTDLSAFYDDNSRYLWSLFALFQFSALLHSVYFGALRQSDKHPLISSGATMAAPLVVSLLLAIIRLRWLHYIAVCLLLLFYLYISWQSTLAT